MPTEGFEPSTSPLPRECSTPELGGPSWSGAHNAILDRAGQAARPPARERWTNFRHYFSVLSVWRPPTTGWRAVQVRGEVSGKNGVKGEDGGEGAVKPGKRAQRESREATALRDNLRRRKAGGQSKRAASEAPGPERPRPGPGRGR